MPAEKVKVVMAKKGGDQEERGEEGARIEPGENGIGGVFTREGKFAEYDVYGNVFEITSKYRPPLKPIGRGAYGVVCSAFDNKTNEGIAIKKISRAFDNKIDAKRTLREIKLLQYLKHENIIAIKDFIPPPSRKEFNDVYIVSELMDTDLGQIIRSGQALTEEHSKYFLYQILRALKYLHSANVLHRDLKPGNLLVNANCDLKICDFGMARTSDMSDFMTEYVVTRWYRAPELLLNAMDYDSAIDVWSVGCIFVELLTGQPLFPGRDYVHQLKSIIELLGTPEDCDLETVKSENARKYVKHLPSYKRKPFEEKFPQLSKPALDLIEKMLTFNPNKRIKVAEALAHPYLSSLHDESDEPTCPKPFVFDFDEQSLTPDRVRDMLYEEALKFNPHLKC